MQTRTVRHSPTHIDIEELRTDENGNQVWAVIKCYNGEDEMTTFSKFDLKVGNHLYTERGELIDDALYAELNNLSFSKVKAERLDEVNEQIRLIENITDENQASYFDPRTPEEKAADAFNEEYNNDATISDIRTGFQQW